MIGARVLVKSTRRKRDGTKEDKKVGTLVEQITAVEWRVGAFFLFLLFLFFLFFKYFLLFFGMI